MHKTFTLLLFLLFQVTALFSQPEFLDPAFGIAGKQVFSRSASDAVRDVVVQPDGKILVAGTSVYRYSLVRYNPDGSLDTGFGVGGKNYTLYWPDYHYGSVYTVALQPDGKIVALGGWTGNLGGGIDLVRYLPDGHPDASFAFPDLTKSLGYVGALDVAPDGKILLAGSKYDGTSRFAVAKFSPDGIKDASFGANGVAVLDLGAEYAYAEDVAVQPDGKIVATGVYGNDLALVRLNVNGTLDTGFNTTGKLLIDGGAKSYYGQFVFLRPDGKTVVGATGPGGISLFRVNPDGSLDDTFGAAGEVKVPGFGKNGGVTDLQMRPDGGFWMTCTDSTGKIVVLKLTEEGVPDTGFADAGILYVSPELHYLAPQADSALVVATTSDGDFALERYLTTGNFDPAFHQGAPVVTDVGQTGGQLHALAMQPDGKAVAVGEKYCCGPAIARLNGDGSLDSGFLARTAFLNNNWGAFYALFPQPDGKIVAGGGIVYRDDSGIQSTEGLLYRFLPDGALDTVFSNKAAAFVKALVRQPDGKFLAAGTDEGKIGHSHYVHPRLVRYETDGTPDSSFGVAGIVKSNPCRCDLLALQPDGKILVAGSKETDTFMVMRYTSSGAPDPAFGTSGHIQEAGGVDAMLLLPGGKILLAANTNDGLTLSQYFEDGAPDAGFGTGGKRFFSLKTDDNIYAMGLQADGKILLAGGAENGLFYDFLLARLLPDGSPDTAVGVDGFIYTDFGGFDYAGALVLQTDGKIILGGGAIDQSAGYDEYRFALARYRGDLAVEAKEVYGSGIQPLELTPNPAGDFLRLRLPGGAVATALSAQVYDASGRLVLQRALSNGQALEVQRLIPGTYMLRVQAGEHDYAGKFVKR